MKKVININFQGRVIPIEETAYDMLKQYIERLRVFFANEEGRDEIINDIEGRIAELFGEVLKKGSTCITQDDVVTIINSMGRPEDFEADEASVKAQLSSDEKTGGDRDRGYTYTNGRKLYRDETHKVLGGVCAGVANYFNIDPLIVRILFILFVGMTWLLYIILWIAIPSSSSVVIGSQRKRLFRDPDNKMIAGVCSGLAQFFSVQVWIPRVLFLIPFISFAFGWGHWGFFDFPHFLSFSFSPGAVVLYIILWLVLPEAKSAADKLEMKGERVDLNTIKSTIQGDLEGFKDRAQQFGNEVRDKAQEFGATVGAAGKQAGATAGATAKKHSGGVGRVLAALLKVFIYIIVGSIVFSIIAGLFTIGVVCTGLLPAYSYVLNDGFQMLLAYGTLIFFIWVPVIGMVTWVIRRLAKKRGNSGFIRMTFISLWVLGWVCFINLLVQIKNDFRYRNYPVEETVALSKPGVNKLELMYKPSGEYYTNHSFRLEPFSFVDEDTAYLENVQVRITKSNTDSFKVSLLKMANGGSKSKAAELASKISYSLNQLDSLLMMDRGFGINRHDKFRNQQVILVVAVPVGKKIKINEHGNWGNHVHLDMGRDDYWEWENNIGSIAYNWEPNVDYVMTVDGLERVNKKERGEDDWNNGDDREDNGTNNDAIDQYRKSKEQLQREKEQKLKDLQQIDKELQQSDSTYRYKPATPAAPAKPAKPTAHNATASSVPVPSDLLMIRMGL